MSHQQATIDREEDPANSSGSGAFATIVGAYRHAFVVGRLERLVEAMQNPETGVPFKSQKAFLSAAVPAAVSGNDLVAWVRERTAAWEPGEAGRIADLLAVYGYVYPLAEPGPALSVRDDAASLYRFQSPYYWLSISGRPDNVDYAIYLTKRMIRSRQKARIEDFEKSALSRLQKLLADRWQFIALQAEEELKLSRERKKNDRVVLDMQEHAYWRVHRPPPGHMNPVDHPLSRHFNADQIQRRIAKGREMHQRLSHQDQLQPAVVEAASASGPATLAHGSYKSVDTILIYHELTRAFDWFLQTVNSSNDASLSGGMAESGGCGGGLSSPWLQDDLANFQSTQGTGESGMTPRQVKLWGTNFDFLLRDAAGREYFRHFLTKEFSSENLHFWLSVQNYKFGPSSQLGARMESIFAEFLAPGAPSEINIDSKTMTATQRGMQSPGRFTFEDAQEHIYLLMKKDSYQRFLRSEDYRSLALASANNQGRKKPPPLVVNSALSFNFKRRVSGGVGVGGGGVGGGGRGGINQQQSCTDETCSLDTSASSSSRPIRSNPVVIVPLSQPRANQPGCAAAADVTPWETEENAVTPWETPTGIPSGNAGWSPPKASGNPLENVVTPWENAENSVTPWETPAGNPHGNPGNPTENLVTPWETPATNPEDEVTPWETNDSHRENCITPWE